MPPSIRITFLLNDRLETAQVPPAQVALDFLRKSRQLTGSKEGCKEGDCGACTVLVGELQDGSIRYQPMTSCLLPMGELHGKHLVSIEGLNLETLSPIQSAMVDCGGTQCGYCTPGFVVAMTAGLMDAAIPLDNEGHDYATSGNLCRCTGYRSIKAAGLQAIEKLKDKLVSADRIQSLCDNHALPKYFLHAHQQLQAIPPLESAPIENGSPPFLAGGTDLFVQRGEELPYTSPLLLNRDPVAPARMEGENLVLDARTTFETFARDPLVQEAIPKIMGYAHLMASWPVRTRATLGGNLCNASPIADMTCLLLALEAVLTLRGPNGERALLLKDFYLSYKSLAKSPEEKVLEISFPLPEKNVCVSWEKVSKRKILDIATVNSAAKLEVKEGRIAKAVLALGGVAATPLFLEKTSSALSGAEFTAEAILDALELAQTEFQPISDVRGSAHYKRLLARQLLASHFTTLFPETITEEELHATLR